MRIITFQHVLEVSDVPLAGGAQLGDRAQTPDGRQWVYVKANEALVLANATTRVANTDQDTVSSSTNGVSEEIFITESGGGFTVNTFENAFGLVDQGTGEGQFFKVENNTDTTLRLYTDYALGTSLDVASSDIVLVRPHLAEKTAVTTLNQIPIGGTQVAFAANDFGWQLERGVGTILAGAALVANELNTPGDNTEGTVITIANGETPDDVSSFGRTLVVNSTADKAAMIDYLVW